MFRVGSLFFRRVSWLTLVIGWENGVDWASVSKEEDAWTYCWWKETYRDDL